MKKLVFSIALFCTVLFGVYSALAISFTDVPADAWYIQDLNEAVGKGLITGITDNTFAPSLNITNAQFITVLVKEKFGEQPAATDGIWYSNYVKKAVEAGIVDPAKGEVAGWDKELTRGMMSVFMCRALGIAPDDKVEMIFADCSAESATNKWNPSLKLYYTYLTKAYKEYLVDGSGFGTGDEFFLKNTDHWKPVNRAQLATIIMRISKYRNGPEAYKAERAKVRDAEFAQRKSEYDEVYKVNETTSLNKFNKEYFPGLIYTYSTNGNIKISYLANQLIDTYFIAAGLYFDFQHSYVMPYTEQREIYRKARDYFSKYKNHGFIVNFKKYSNSLFGVNFNYVAALLKYTDMPKVEKIYFQANRQPADTNTEEFINDLRKFYSDTQAQTFFIQNKDIYDALGTYISSQIEKSKVVTMIDELENYAGTKDKYFKKNLHYSTTLSFFKFDASSLRLENKDEINLPTVTQAFKYSRGSDEFEIIRNIYTMIHEAFHQYNNYSTRVSPDNKKLVDSLTTDKGKKGYASEHYIINQNADWYYILDENITRAVCARLFKKVYGENIAYAEIINPETNKGFEYIRRLYLKLDEYEKNRDKYPTIDDFIPELIKELYK